jgi:hypothetical protein
VFALDGDDFLCRRSALAQRPNATCDGVQEVGLIGARVIHDHLVADSARDEAIGPRP